MDGVEPEEEELDDAVKEKVYDSIREDLKEERPGSKGSKSNDDPCAKT